MINPHQFTFCITDPFFGGTMNSVRSIRSLAVLAMLVSVIFLTAAKCAPSDTSGGSSTNQSDPQRYNLANVDCTKATARVKAKDGDTLSQMVERTTKGDAINPDVTEWTAQHLLGGNHGVNAGSTYLIPEYCFVPKHKPKR